ATKSNDNHWTVILGGQPFMFDHTHPQYAALIECVHTEDADQFVELINTGHQIEDWSEGDFEFRDGFLYFEDEQVASQPTSRVIEMIQQGFPHKPMLNYLTNLYDNVSERAVQESYTWSSHKGLPITDDGMMVGYKGVRPHAGDTIKVKNGELKDGDLVDIYTGKTFRNNVGDVCTMKRRQVCDDHTKGCDTGLHVGTYEYACNWAGNAGVVVLVKFNPKDIVSVPSDCECQKMRVSEYEVMAIAREQLEEAVYEFDDVDECIEDDYDYSDF
ncbi:MAG: hypothetical protein VW270_20845, partial [Candidatus Poseidoniales archaeon]